MSATPFPRGGRIADPTEAHGPLSGGDGGGTYNEMLERVAKLEAQVETLGRDMGELKTAAKDLSKDATDLKVSLATLVERVNNLPGKAFLLAAIAGGASFVLVVFGIASYLAGR